MKQFIITADVFVGKEKFCSVEREIWAETPNAAKMEFERTNKGSGLSVKNLSVKELEGIKTHP